MSIQKVLGFMLGALAGAIIVQDEVREHVARENALFEENSVKRAVLFRTMRQQLGNSQHVIDLEARASRWAHDKARNANKYPLASWLEHFLGM